jgi:type VI secretion system protein ImpL
MKLLKKILLILLYAILLLALLGVGWLFERIFNWPIGSMWLWAIIPLVAYFGFVLVRKIYIEYQIRKRLRTQLLKEELTVVDKEWSAGVQAYIQSQKVPVNPLLNFLRNLPWIDQLPFLKNALHPDTLGHHRIHFVMGMPGSGKSTLLKRSNLSVGIGNSAPDQEITHTQSCAFEFMESGIGIELSGSYIDPSQENAERQNQWNTLLSSIKLDVNPLNVASIVVCVSAEDLQEKNLETTMHGFKNLSKCLHDLMTFTQKRLPVYVVLTKIDTLNGVDQYLKALNFDVLTMPAGSLATIDKTDSARHIKDSLAEIKRYFPWLALRSSQADGALDSSLLKTTKSLESTFKPLQAVITNLIQSSNYLHTPVFRGIFLSAELSKVALQAQGHAHTPRLAFGAGLINDVLKQDRIYIPLGADGPELFRPSQLRWMAYYGGIALIGTWIFLGFSFESKLLQDTKNIELVSVPEQNDDIRESVSAVLATQPAVKWLEEANSDWRYLLPYSWVTSEISQIYENNFIDVYADFYENITETILKQYFQNKQDKDDPLVTAKVIESLVQSVLLRQDVFNDQSLVGLQNDFENQDMTSLKLLQTNVDEADIIAVNTLFLNWISWLPEAELYAEQQKTLQRLEEITRRNNDLSWVKAWVEKQPGVNEQYLSDFWAPTAPQSGHKIAGKYTLDGYKKINKLLTSINQIDALKRVYAERIIDFQYSYRVERDIEWQKFALRFDEGQKLLNTQNDWKSTLVSLNSVASPYSRFAQKVLTEFPEDNPNIERPRWVKSLALDDAIRQNSISPTVLSKVSNELSFIDRMISFVKGSYTNKSRASSGKDILKANTIYGKYNDAFTKLLAEAINSPGQAAGLATNYSGLGTDPLIKDSSIKNTLLAFDNYTQALEFKTETWNEPALKIMKGSLNFAIDYAFNEADCTLQNAWDSQVIFAIKSGADAQENNDKLYGDDGVLISFLKGPVKPFLRANESGFTAIRLQDKGIDWDLSFIPFINDFTEQKKKLTAQKNITELQEKLIKNKTTERIKVIDQRISNLDKILEVYTTNKFDLKIQGDPVFANPEALVKPYGFELTLSCSNGQQRLTQLNFLTSQTFVWNPSTCGKTELIIFIDDKKLIKTWDGDYGFSTFLAAFKSGAVSFTLKDFPEFATFFKANQLTRINVAMRFSGDAKKYANAIKYKSLFDEKNNLAQEKSQLENTQLNMTTQKLESQLNAYTSSNIYPPIPDKIARCIF